MPGRRQLGVLRGQHPCTIIACAESCDQINDTAAATTRQAATKGGSTFQSSSSGSDSDDSSTYGAIIGVVTILLAVVTVGLALPCYKKFKK